MSILPDQTRFCWRVLLCFTFFLAVLPLAIAQDDSRFGKNNAASTKEDFEQILEKANRAKGFWEKGDYAKALPLYEEVLPYYEKSLGTDAPALARLLITMGKMYADHGERTKGLAFLQRSLKIIEKSERTEEYAAGMTTVLMLCITHIS